MAISDTEKVDFLLKKVGYGLAKTDLGINKSPDNETLSSPITISSANLWLDSIDPTPATAIAAGAVEALFVELVPDPTANVVGGIYRTWKLKSEDSAKNKWLSKAYGAYTFTVKVANSGAADESALTNASDIQQAGTGNNGFFIDYTAGTIHFPDSAIPAALTEGKSIYIIGYRYIGALGSDGIARNSLNLEQFQSTDASGLRNIINGTTGSGSLVFQSGSQLYNLDVFDGIEVSGNSTFYDNVNISGNLNVSGSVTIAGASFSQSSVTLVNFSANSGNFTTGLTVGHIPVSLEGHEHVWSDINIVPGDGFCDDVASCVNTPLSFTNGIDSAFADNTLTISLTGQASGLHNMTTNGFFVRKNNQIVGRSIEPGNSNIVIGSGDGQDGNPTIGLSSNINVSNIYVGNDVDITGNLYVRGDSIIANVSVIEVEDPTIRVGKGSGENFADPDNLDRGIEFVYPTGASNVATTGFFGFDRSEGVFTVIPVHTGVNSNIYDGLLGTIKIGRLWSTGLIGGTSVSEPATLQYCVIDGGTPS